MATLTKVTLEIILEENPEAVDIAEMIEDELQEVLNGFYDFIRADCIRQGEVDDSDPAVKEFIQEFGFGSSEPDDDEDDEENEDDNEEDEEDGE